MGVIVDFASKTAISAARSLLLSEVKGKVKSFLHQKRMLSPQDIHNQMIKDIGYATSHYSLAKKDQKIVYKPSALFIHEWLTNSPYVTEKFVRDEESGHVYVDGAQIDGKHDTKVKLDLINRFIKCTQTNSASILSYMDNALKLLAVSDLNADKFAKHFAGWDPAQPSVIDTFLEKAFGDVLQTDKDYARLLFRKWMIGSAKRAMQPGCTFDGCLVISGPAGVGKTMFFRNILPAPFSERTGEIVCNIKNTTRFVESIKGKTVACFDELSVLDYPKTEETFKQLLSQQFIDVRLAWAREAQRYELRQGFCATTNKEQFIPDEFFSRRLWTIELNNKGRLNFDFLQANRELLWKEAVYLAKNNTSHLLSFDEQKMVENHNAKFLKK